MAQYDEIAISIITWMEVMVGAKPETAATTRSFLKFFEVIPLNEDIAERAVELRRENRLKLPDAIIWATADVNSLLLVTRNIKDFRSGYPGIRLPYSM